MAKLGHGMVLENEYTGCFNIIVTSLTVINSVNINDISVISNFIEN